jgi:hypothetical protein
MAHQDDGFLREVEEELRRERLEKIWRQYGTYILIVAALIVFGVLGYKYWENSRMVAAQSMGARYEGALHLCPRARRPAPPRSSRRSLWMARVAMRRWRGCSSPAHS